MIEFVRDVEVGDGVEFAHVFGLWGGVTPRAGVVTVHVDVADGYVERVSRAGADETVITFPRLMRRIVDRTSLERRAGGYRPTL